MHVGVGRRADNELYLGCVEHSVTTRAKLFKIVVKNNLHFIPVDMGIIEFGS